MRVYSPHLRLFSQGGERVEEFQTGRCFLSHSHIHRDRINSHAMAYPLTRSVVDMPIVTEWRKEDVERQGIWFVVDPPGSCCCFIGDKTEIPYPPTHKWRLSSCCWGSRAYNSCFCQTQVRNILHSALTFFRCFCFYSNTPWLKTTVTSLLSYE